MSGGLVRVGGVSACQVGWGREGGGWCAWEKGSAQEGGAYQWGPAHEGGG